MNKTLLILFLFFSANVVAANLPPADSKLIEAAGVPFYSDAVFANGSKDAGFRFATNISPEKVQEWYRQQLPGWSLFNEYGGWILYNGAPGKGMSDVMSSNQVSIQRNENLPQWFSLDKNMTTEIVIMIVK